MTILVDANLLIYAFNKAAAQHEVARDWLETRLTGSARVGLPWASLLAFLRIVTNPRLFPRAVDAAGAWQQIANWLSSDAAWIPVPTERHAALLAPILTLPGVRGDLVPDAHLAALAMEHGLTLCSNDGDFARFPGLRWQNPLVAA
ncbi:MAG TPA: TA system VapC family ribonuclease toxin [Stellaceae bacterium]|nr:TA system VapC family ribonuclease toxin [Stellaceae bacterium]